jgi:hypothetical protein
MLSLVASYQVVSRGKGRLLMDELFNMVSFFTLLRAVKRALFGRGRRGRFEVTNKRGTERNLRPVLPHLLLLGFSTLAIAWSLMGLGFGINDDVRGAAPIIFWTLYNGRLMVGALKLGGRPSEKRRASRFRANFAVESKADDAGRGPVGVTADISEGGCSLLWPEQLAVGQRVPLRLHFGSQTVEWIGEVESDEGRRSDGWYQSGVRFLNLTARDVDLINDTVFSIVVPDLFTTLSQPAWFTRRWRRLAQFASRVAPRSARRQVVRVPARVSHAGGSFLTTVRDLSATGLSLQAPVPVAVGSDVTVTMMTPIRTWSGAASVVRSDPRPSRRGFETWLLGLKFETEQRSSEIRPFRRWDAA